MKRKVVATILATVMVCSALESAVLAASINDCEMESTVFEKEENKDTVEKTETEVSNEEVLKSTETVEENVQKEKVEEKSEAVEDKDLKIKDAFTTYNGELVAEIVEENFPNENFREFLKGSSEFTFKLEVDGEERFYTLPSSKRIVIPSDKGITDITGIEYFKNLQYLDVSGCNIEKLDLKEHANLGTLKARWVNGLKQIDVSGCKKLTSADIFTDEGYIDQFNANGCEALSVLVGYENVVNLDISNTSIKELDLKTNEVLKTLVADNAKFKSLNCENCLNIEKICIRDSMISEIDVKGLEKLQSLILDNTNIETLVIDKCTALKELSARVSKLSGLEVLNSNKIETIDLSGSLISKFDVGFIYSLRHLYLQRCSNLKVINVILSRELDDLKIDESLNIERITISESGIKELDLRPLKSLQYLNLNKCAKIEKIDVSWCSNLAEIVLWGCTNLKELYASGTQIETLELYNSGVKNIEKVDVAGCTALKTLNAPHCKYLTDVNLQGCSGIVELDLIGVAITELDISDSINIEKLFLGYCRSLKKVINKETSQSILVVS